MRFMTMKRITDLGVLALLWIFHLKVTSGHFDANFTLQNIWGRLQAKHRSIIQCLSDTSHKAIKFSRKLDTGQGEKLSKSSRQYLQANPVNAKILLLPEEEKHDQFGVYQCKIMKNKVATEIITLKLPPSNVVELDAINPYNVAGIGDVVELVVNMTQKLELPIRWRHNGNNVPNWDDQLRVEIQDVQVKDSGIYECFYKGRRNEGVHALMRLIVRNCPTALYGVDCDKECPPCYNGGICHDKWGDCVCPAGFTGRHCEIACGGNHFGSKCSKFCTPPQNNSNSDELCASHLFCKPDPYGCSCAPGFKGSSCMEHCEPGWYGADCKQPCHCAYGISSCNRITGACDGGCARTWKGDSCQIEDPNANNNQAETTTMIYCSLGRYGPSCERPCHCAGHEHCHVVTGYCPSGCQDGWGGPSCSVCRPGRFGDNCQFICHCEGGHHNCDKEGFCYSGCEAGWAGFTCQAECTPGRFGPNCASTCHCHENSTHPCNKISGVCEGDCEAGYMEKDCQTHCPQNKYGVNCVYTCTCLNGGQCSRVDGSCSCDGRWKGLTCNESEPQIVAAMDEEVNTGQLVYVSCTADAVPEPVMSIASSNHTDLTVVVRSLEKNQYQAVVKVKPTNAGQFEFICSARNDHGFGMKKMTLFVIEPPRLTSSPWLLVKTNHSLTLGWRDWEYGKDTGGSPMDKIEYMVTYRRKGSIVWEKVDSWTTELTNTIENLIPNTMYEVAVRCRRFNKGGEGDVSPEIFVETECGVPTANGLAQEVLPDLISQTNVSLTWKNPLESPLRCALKGYYLTYHPEADETILQSMELDANTNTAYLEDLSPNTVYVIRLYAVTFVEKSKYFVELTLRTSETVPDSVSLLKYHIMDDQPDSLLLSWEAPSEQNGVIKGYAITMTLLDRGHCGYFDDSELSEVMHIASNNTEITLQNLHPYSIYNVSVRGKTSAGEGEAVSILAETIEGAPDESPPNTRVLSSSSRSLEFAWDPIPCEFSNGIISNYEYVVLEQKDTYPMRFELKKRSVDVPFPNSTIHAIDGLRVNIEDLLPDTEYGFMVRGVVAGIGEGPMSNILFHKTEEDIPSQPRHLFIVSTSAHSLGLSWSKPEMPNGKITQYRVQLWDHENSNLTADVVVNVTDPYGIGLNTVVGGLTPATDFFIKIQASTNVGWGEYCSPIFGRTLDGIPGEPSEISVVHSGQTFLNLTWKEPSRTNGFVTGYKVIYEPVVTLDPVFNSTPFTKVTLEVGGDVKEVLIKHLHPSTEYQLSVSAKTSAGHGPNATISSWTVILGDHVSPSLRTLDTEVSNETIRIAFSTTGSTAVYKYQVIVENGNNSDPINEDLLSDYETAVVKQHLPYYIAAELDPRNVSTRGTEHPFVVGDRQNWGGYRNVHLNPGHSYKIRIRTLVFKDSEIKSVLSEPEEKTVASSTTQVNKRFNLEIVGIGLIEFILILFGLLVLLTATIYLTIFVICMRKRRKISTNSFSTRDSGLSESMTWSVMYKGPDNDAKEGPLIMDGYKTFPMSEKFTSLKRTKSDSKIARGLRIEMLEDFLTNALATNQLSEDFKRLVDGQTSSWTIARKNLNLKKNRYGNILPYDRCRVVLKNSNKNDSDYINASYIDGYSRPREYIITQGPLDSTIEDFWRMVWQENSSAIVMVTDLIENGKKKCAKYWPDDSMDCGDFQILLIRSEEVTDFVVRTLLMRKADEIRTHRILQYQFTAWPDRTVPLNTNYFIKFLKRIRDDHPVMSGPLIVHCSAGAGRSGTYVAIDALCQQAKEDRRVEVFRFVNNARHQRVHLVQTLEQYIFIYEALVEAIHFEDTTVQLDKIGNYLKELDHMSTLDQRALILKQYNKLNRTQKKVDANRCSTALAESNIFKNRDPLTIPFDSARVRLQSSDSTESVPDYINAIYVDGYRKKDAYLVTQIPLSHTINDFWRMIYQHKSSLIVALNGSEETEDLSVGIYWPEYGDSSYGEFDVQLIQFEDQGDFLIRIMRLTSAEKKNEEPIKVIQLQYNSWSSEMKPASMLKLLQNVELWYQRSAGGPITVHCMDGATRSGLFIAARNVCDQMVAEGVLDVYQVVKRMRVSRPEFIPNSDQYRFLFEMAQEISDPILKKCEETQSTKKLSFKI